MIIYLDSDFRCHLANDGTMKEVETDFFNGKCDAFIEGYRFVPAGEIWVRDDDVEFVGEMIAPARDYSILAELQEQYEEILAEAHAAYENGVNSI
jgi:hypothetical protein